jgi:hypothetical protein
MLTIYPNSSELLSSTYQQHIKRIYDTDNMLIQKHYYNIGFNTTDKNLNIELHVYSPDNTYIYSAYNQSYSIASNTSTNAVDNHIILDTINLLNDNFDITRGQFKIVYNFFADILGSYNTNSIFIKAISPDRTEVQLQLTNTNDIASITSYDTLSDIYTERQTLFNNLRLQTIQNRTFNSSSLNTPLTIDSSLLTFTDTTPDNLQTAFFNQVLNFGRNETYLIINSRFEDYEDPDTGDINKVVYLKLYSPLLSIHQENDICWLSEEIRSSVLQTVFLVDYVSQLAGITISGPNFDIDTDEYKSLATTYKTWNDLIGTTPQTSQQIIDNYFGTALTGIKLHIDYRYFKNYIHFSSAEERVRNFFWKIKRIEYYTQQISIANNVNSALKVQNILKLKTLRNNIVTGFDDFEKYLFFSNTTNTIYTNYNEDLFVVTPYPKNSSSTNSWMDTWVTFMTAAQSFNGDSPKYKWTDIADTFGNTTKTYIGSSLEYTYFDTLLSSESTSVLSWYSSLIDNAKAYDRANVHKLINTIPTFLQIDTDNEAYILFINMIGQHYDILWSYIQHLRDINVREENPEDGLSDDLLYDIAKSLGFTLYNGTSTTELWKYAIDTNPQSKTTKEIWRRLINNLPYLLQTKGTSRAVKAILSCFGIPNSLLTIKEYGGPTSNITSKNYFWSHDVYHNSFVLDSTNKSGINIQFNSHIKGIELRFKTDSNYIYPIDKERVICAITSPVSQSNIVSNIITLTNNNNNLGTLKRYVVNDIISGSTKIISKSIADIKIYDDTWNTLYIDTYDTKILKAKYGNLIYNLSGSLLTTQDYTSIGLPNTTTLSPGNYNNLLFGKFLNRLDTITASLNIEISPLDSQIYEVRGWLDALNDRSLKEHTLSPSTYTFNTDNDITATGNEGNLVYDNLYFHFPLTNQSNSQSIQPNTNYSSYIILINEKWEGAEETYYTPYPSLGNKSLFTEKVRIEENKVLDDTLYIDKSTESSSYDKYSLDSNKVGIYFSPENPINMDIINQLGYFELDDYIGDPSYIYKESYSTLNTLSKQYWQKFKGKFLNINNYINALQIYDFTVFKYILDFIPYRVNAITGLVIEPTILERSKILALHKPEYNNNTLNSSTKASNTIKIIPTISQYSGSLLSKKNIILTPTTEQMNTQIKSNINDINKIHNGDPVSQIFYTLYKTDTNGELTDTNRIKIITSFKYTPILVQNQYNNTIINPDISFSNISNIYCSASLGTIHIITRKDAAFKPNAITLDKSTQINNLKFNGCKITATDINVNTSITPDGGPIIRSTTVNPNKLIFSNNKLTTGDNAILVKKINN